MTEQIKDEVTKSENEVVGTLLIEQCANGSHNIKINEMSGKMLIASIDNIIEVLGDKAGVEYEETYRIVMFAIAEANGWDTPTFSTELGD